MFPTVCRIFAVTYLAGSIGCQSIRSRAIPAAALSMVGLRVRVAIGSSAIGGPEGQGDCCNSGSAQYQSRRDEAGRQQ